LFPSGGVVESREDVPFEVEARDFQSGDFANSQATKRCDQEHEFERLDRSVDDSRRGIRVEEKYLCPRRLVGREFDIFPSDVGNEIAPLLP
jgi:hypothetical protein